MMCAARLAHRLGRVDDEFVDRQQALLDSIGFARQASRRRSRSFARLMQHDKKTQSGQLRFILPTRLGHVELVGEVAVADVQAALCG